MKNERLEDTPDSETLREFVKSGDSTGRLVSNSETYIEKKTLNQEDATWAD